ncbi:hypothetical protein BDW59DRAFT_145968 [Aspergillus cavernicola]|uniref:Uncharacterized protein n=1 Tax=Aspergillus cavernicola TaxID=176166 RepID=A0ABR4ICT7_9EURO
MKAAFITAIAALATSVVAAPTKVISAVETIESATQALPLNMLAAPTATSGGHVVQDLGPEVHDVLEVTGPNAERLLLQLSPEVTSLLSGLGLPAVGAPVGAVVASASSLGELVRNLGPHTENLLTVVSEGGDYLLIELSSTVSGLLSGLGLPAVGTSVGSIVATLGQNLKRDMIVGDIVPNVRDILEVTGPNAKRLLVQLSPEVASLLSGLGLPNVGEPVGEVVEDASSVGDLVNDLGVPVQNLLTVTGDDGKAILIRLSPSVASLLSGLGLPAVGTSAMC